MTWKPTLFVLIAAASLALLPTGCGPSAPDHDPSRPPAGQDPEIDYLPGNGAAPKAAKKP
ncbi:hypothetical protein TA3x_001922 [Tundrisphaera sp. TA3]|uniref:hypothetical protein n=1 Tax=Tundrisphaera sp. TA3 TaxID=3435775 RepID=UPI003EBE951C